MTIYLILALNMCIGIVVQSSRVALPLYALELGAHPFVVGMLGATFSAFPMLLAVTAGRLSDRFGARWPLALGMLCGALGMLMPYAVPAMPAVFAAAALIGLSTAISIVSLQNLVGQLSESHRRAQNFSNYSMSNAINNFTGPVAAGFLIDHAGYATACLSIALFALVPVVVLVIWGRKFPGGTREAPRSSGGVLSTLANPEARRVLAVGSLQHVGDSLYQFYMPVYAHQLGLSASVIGIVLAMYAAAAFVVRTVLTRLITRLRAENLLVYAFYLGAASLILIPFFQGAVMLALISFMFGLGMGCCGPIVTMQMFESSPQGRSGETLGLKITVNHLTKVVSPVVFGALGSAFGLPPIFWLNGVLLGVGGLFSRPRRVA